MQCSSSELIINLIFNNIKYIIILVILLKIYFVNIRRF